MDIKDITWMHWDTGGSRSGHLVESSTIKDKDLAEELCEFINNKFGELKGVGGFAKLDVTQDGYVIRVKNRTALGKILEELNPDVKISSGNYIGDDKGLWDAKNKWSR